MKNLQLNRLREIFPIILITIGIFLLAIIPAQAEASENMLANWHFEEWEDGDDRPDSWTGSHAFTTNWHQDEEYTLEGQYSVRVGGAGERTLRQLGEDLVAPLDTETEYYAEVWVLGSGQVEVGIEGPDGDNDWSDPVELDNAGWTRISHVYTTSEDAGDDGGLEIKTDDAGGASPSTTLYIGAAWLDTSPPPAEWVDAPPWIDSTPPAVSETPNFDQSFELIIHNDTLVEGIDAGDISLGGDFAGHSLSVVDRQSDTELLVEFDGGTDLVYDDGAGTITIEAAGLAGDASADAVITIIPVITEFPHNEYFEHDGQVPPGWTFEGFSISTTGTHRSKGDYAASLTSGEFGTLETVRFDFSDLTPDSVSFEIRGTGTTTGSTVAINASIDGGTTYDVPVLEADTFPDDEDHHQYISDQDLNTLEGEDDVRFKWSVSREGGVISVDDIWFYASEMVVEPDTHLLTVEDPDSGTISVGGVVAEDGDTFVLEEGVDTDLEAAADAGYQFVEWSVTDGAANIANISDSSTQLNLEEDATLTAVFQALIPYIEITRPQSSHDTNVTPIWLAGTAGNFVEGDTIEIVRNGTVDTVIAASDDWSGTAAVSTVGETVVARLHSGSTVVSDTITVNYYQPSLAVNFPPDQYDTRATTIPVNITCTNTINDHLFTGIYGQADTPVAYHIWENLTGVDASLNVDTVLQDIPPSRDDYEVISGIYDTGIETLRGLIEAGDTDTLVEAAKYLTIPEREDTPPILRVYPNEVTINEPADGEALARVADVSGTAALLAGDTVELTVESESGETALYSFVSDTHEFNYGWVTNVLLFTDTNTVTARLIDGKSDQVVAMDEITLMGLPAVVNFDSPETGAFTRADSIDVGGTVAHASAGDSVEIRVNEELKTVAELEEVEGEASFDTAVDITPGANEVKATVLSAVHGDTLGAGQVLVNKPSPAVTITSPVSGGVVTAGDSVTVGGTAAVVPGDTVQAVIYRADGEPGDATDTDYYVFPQGSYDISWGPLELTVPSDTTVDYVIQTDLLAVESGASIASDSVVVNADDIGVSIDAIADTRVDFLDVTGQVTGVADGDTLGIYTDSTLRKVVELGSDSATWSVSGVPVLRGPEIPVLVQLYRSGVQLVYGEETFNNYRDQIEIIEPADGDTSPRVTDVTLRADLLEDEKFGFEILPEGGEASFHSDVTELEYERTFSDSLLNEGQNTILAKLRGVNDDLLATDSIEVTGLAAKIEFDDLDTGAFVRSDSLTVTGTVEYARPDDQIRIFVNQTKIDSQPLTNGEVMTWSFSEVQIDSGYNLLELEVECNWSRWIIGSTSLVLNNVDPVLYIDSPDSGEVYAINAPVTVSGRAGALEGDSLVVTLAEEEGDYADSEIIVLTASGYEVSWDTSLTMGSEAGSYALSAELYDGDGGSSLFKQTILLEAVDMMIAITAPEDDLDTRVDLIDVRGTTEGSLTGDTVELSLNGESTGDIYELPSDEAGWEFTDVSLPEGEVEIKATLSGNGTTISATHTVKNYPNKISITSPEPDETVRRLVYVDWAASVLKGETLTITVTGEPGSSVQVKETAPGNYFELEMESDPEFMIELYRGNNTILIELSNEAGVFAHDSVEVTYEQLLRVLQPYRNQLIADTEVTWELKVDATKGDTLTIRTSRDSKEIGEASAQFDTTARKTITSTTGLPPKQGVHELKFIQEFVDSRLGHDTISVRRRFIRDNDSSEATAQTDDGDTVYSAAGRRLRARSDDLTPGLRVSVSSRPRNDTPVSESMDEASEAAGDNYLNLSDLAEESATRFNLSADTKDVTFEMSLPFDPAKLNGVNPNALRIFRLEELAEGWRWTVRDIEHVRVDSDTVVARVTGFSVFQIMSDPYEEDLRNLKYGPNPFRPNDGLDKTGDYTPANQPRFDNLPAGRIKVEIYTITGSLVYSGREVDVPDGQYKWDGRNNSGDKVASGYYIWYIEDDSGNSKTGKLAVIR